MVIAYVLHLILITQLIYYVKCLLLILLVLMEDVFSVILIIPNVKHAVHNML